MAPRSEGPQFEPRKQWYEHLFDVFSHLLGAVKSGRRLLREIDEMESTDRRAVGAGALGALGLGGTIAAALTSAVDVAFAYYVLVASIFQAPWIWRAVPIAVSDSQRRRQMYRARREEAANHERYEKTRRWRHTRASSFHGRLRSPLEKCEVVGELMQAAVEKASDLTDRPFALILVRKKRRGRLYQIVLTKGDTPDCLKTGTKWSARDMDVYEYVEKLYPCDMIEREMLGDDEYFLIAVSEIDVIGATRECVLDCFLDMVDQGIGRVVAYTGA